MTDSFTPDGQSRAFRDALGRFTTGVTVVTVHGEDGPVGITANSFASVSLDPPLVLWSPARGSSRFTHFERAERFAIHVLGADQVDVAARFTRGGMGFEGLELDPGDLPLIPGALVRFECTTHGRHDGGDHLIVVGRVDRVTLGGGAPLVFSHGTYGHFTAGI